MRHSPALALVLIAAARPALVNAAPLATLSADLDGDGALDRAELDERGTLTVTTKAGTGTLTTGVTTRATLTGAPVRGTPTILLRAGSEAIVLQGAGTQWKLLLRTQAGGVGLDADYATELAVLPEGVFRFQTRGGAYRCDGKPALLFGERYEGGRFQRLARLPTFVPERAPVITARLDPQSAPEPAVYRARVASHQVGAPNAGVLAIPSELDDGTLTTAWREELVASAGEGQFFTFTPRFAGARATQIRIVPGTQKGANRPQRLAVVASSGAWRIELPDAQKDPANSAYLADLPAPVEGCVSIVLESTYGPDKGTTSIAELVVYGEGERSGGGEAALARVVAAGADGANAAAQELARRGASGVAAIEDELGRTKDPKARSRLLRAVIAVRDPAAGALIARAAQQGALEGPDLIDAIDALADRGQGPMLHELATRQALPLEARLAAIRALSPTVDKERDLLIRLAGSGPRTLRQAVIDQLAKVPVATLVPLAQAQGEPAIAGDLWRAITRRGHAVDAERAAAADALVAALPGAADYDRRYRLVDGIATLGDAAALRQLTTFLRALPANAPESAGIRHAAARAIGVAPRPEASDLLIELTRDRDPGVRLAALSSMAAATGTSSGPWHGDAGVDGIDRVIMTMLATDTWPEVRRAAAQTLGTRCGRPGPARALADAVARDPELDVRGDALAGLVACKATGTAELLAKLWDDGKAPLPLRQRAVDLTVALGDRALAGRLAGKLGQWRGSAIESEAALALAQNAAYALGRLPVPGAAEALIAALDDMAFPEIVAAAATSLGLLGPACPASARPRLTALAESSDEPQVQIAAKRAAAQCGKR